MIYKRIRKKSRLFSVLFSLILIPVSTDPLACAYGPDEEELRYMLFNPDLLEDKSWWTFFYSFPLDYRNGEVHADTDERLLVREWMDHVNLAGHEDDAFQALFGNLSDSALLENRFYQAIQENELAKDYFKNAKKAEALFGSRDYWAEEDQQLPAKRADFEQTIRHVLDQQTDPFWKKKYAFQLLKAAFYTNHADAFNQCYNTFFKGNYNSVLDWWALHYKAEVLSREDKPDSANLLHARVFSNASAKMLVSKQQFSTEQLDAILALAATPKERADVLILAGVINPGRNLDGIQQIYELNPEHKHLPLLIMREINKLENWLASEYVVLTGPDGSYSPERALSAKGYQQDLDYAAQFAQALNNMRPLAIKTSDVYELAAAYVNLLAGNTAAATQHLDQVKTNKFLFQKRVLEIILLARTADVNNQAIQDQLGKKLIELMDNRNHQFESDKVLFSLCSYLRYEFARKGLIAYAGLFNNLANNKFCTTCSGSSLEYEQIEYFDYHASATDVEKLLSLYHNQSKNSLEALLIKPYSNVNYLYDLQAVKYLREGKTEQALQVLRKIPDDFWYSFSNANKNLNQNPFTENSELLMPASMDVYNKREIVERLIALEAEAARVPAKQADNYFLLANAWYNFSENSWFMLRYSWSNYPSKHEDQINRSARTRARSYYEFALSAERNPERKAKIFYMLVLLNDLDDAEKYAREYEALSETKFYKKRNCLTIADLAGN